jgi:translation initiation factor IF-3
MRPTRSADRTNINQDIRARQVRAIDPEGNQLGVIPTEQALAAAAEFGLDLVEVSPNADPPVCKIMDYGRYRYEQTKKKHEAKKKQASFKLKEIKVRPKTGQHDLGVKIGGEKGKGSQMRSPAPSEYEAAQSKQTRARRESAASDEATRD